MDDFSYDMRTDGSAGELDQLGSAPDLPFADLNLAGSSGTPQADAIASPAMDMQLRQPDYLTPDMCEPSLVFGNLAMADIDFIPELTPDPMQPDLIDIPKPAAMDIYNDPFMSCFPIIAQDIPSDAEIAASIYPGLGFTGMEVVDDPEDIDSPLPDLQNPQLSQEIVMQDRPGELDDSAMDVAKETPQIEQDQEDLPSYQTSFMDQTGDNDRRERHIGLLLSGLEDPGKTLF